jgi:hypothetical protein
VISLTWMLVTAAGFMVSGALLWNFELAWAAGIFAFTWMWMAFPKAVGWTLGLLGGLVKGKGRTTPVRI